MTIPQVPIAATSSERRFFLVDDGGADYIIVAVDVEHAKKILLAYGVEFTTEEGDSAPVDDPKFADLSWKEMPPEWVATKVIDDDGVKRPLADCILGDWFCSEY